MSSPARISPAVRAELERAQQIGAIGPGSLEEHIAHARGFATLIAELSPKASILDLGSGGGLPGLVLAAEEASGPVTLLEGRTERAHQLEEAVERLGWETRVCVLVGRAEALARGECRGTFDVVVARSFGPPAVTAECAAGFLREGGWLIVSEPPDGSEDRWPAPGLHELGLQLDSVRRVPFGFALIRQPIPCPDRYPRRVGIPAKRPLF